VCLVGRKLRLGDNSLLYVKNGAVFKANFSFSKACCGSPTEVNLKDFWYNRIK